MLIRMIMFIQLRIILNLIHFMHTLIHFIVRDSISNYDILESKAILLLLILHYDIIGSNEVIQALFLVNYIFIRFFSIIASLLLDHSIIFGMCVFVKDKDFRRLIHLSVGIEATTHFVVLLSQQLLVHAPLHLIWVLPDAGLEWYLETYEWISDTGLIKSHNCSDFVNGLFNEYFERVDSWHFQSFIQVILVGNSD